MPLALKDTKLFKPIKVGAVTLKNRIAYPPTTRIRNTAEFVPTDSVLEYYRERAVDNGGLLIFEATFPDYNFGLYHHTPMIKTEQQVGAFKKIVDAVHQENTSIALQLWNLGRTADPQLLKKQGLDFVAPSAIYDSEEKEKQAKEVGNELRELTVPEIKAMVKEYGAAAKRAVEEAGFDFIEIHAAHMYLPDQFLQEVSNTRTDEYGGSIENRARFILEIIDECIKVVGAEHVGIRLSPYAEVQGGLGIKSKINPVVTWGYLFSEFESRAKKGDRLAYVSIVEPRVNGIEIKPENAEINLKWPELIWKGIFLRSGGFLHEPYISNIEESIENSDNTIFGFGRFFTSNPDLPNRLKNGYELTPYERDGFYIPQSNKKYLGFPRYGEERDTSKDDIAPQAL